MPQAVANENAVDNIARVTEITRNIYRQANVKAVLFAAVNDVGRHWNASRCVAGLCTPGKPPAAALEYCAPGIKQSDVMAIVKLIGSLQALAVGQGPVAIPNVKSAPELAPIPLGWSLPFVLLLACIALMPFIARHFWERNYRNVSFGLALLVAVYYIFYRQDSMTWLREMKEYVLPQACD